jgi:hypothetical protein
MAPAGSQRQLVTCGIGGAYLDVTHGLATELRLLPKESRSWREGDNEATFRVQPAMFPSEADSRAQVARLGWPWRKEWIVRRNPGVFSFFAVAQVLIFITILLTFWQGVSAVGSGRIIDAYLRASPQKLLTFAAGLVGVMVFVFLIALFPMLRRRPPLLSVSAMVLTMGQLLVACACFVGLALLPVGPIGPLSAWPKFFAVILGVAVIGGTLGAIVLGLWIVAFKSEGIQSWAMMGQAVEEGKGFLRIRLGSDGVLTIHPIVTEQLVRDYDISPGMVDTSAGRPTRIPVPRGPLPTPRLIEQPFLVRPTVAAGPAGPPPGLGPVGVSETLKGGT